MTDNDRHINYLYKRYGIYYDHKKFYGTEQGLKCKEKGLSPRKGATTFTITASGIKTLSMANKNTTLNLLTLYSEFSLMLRVVTFFDRLSVVMLSVIRMSVLAPRNKPIKNDE